MSKEDKTGPFDSLIRHLQQRSMDHENPGYINTATEFRAYLSKAGFINILITEIPDTSMGFVLGRKPKLPGLYLAPDCQCRRITCQ